MDVISDRHVISGFSVSWKKVVRHALLALCILLADFVKAETHISGSISEDQVWTLAGSPYILQGSVSVLDNVTLTIEPGVLVEFVPGMSSSLSINYSSTISANGTLGEPIIFTSHSPSPGIGDYYGLVFFTLSPESVSMSNCFVEYASAGLYAWGPISVDQVILRKNQCGIEAQDLFGVVEGFIIHNNESAGIQVMAGTHITIQDCQIFENGGNGISSPYGNCIIFVYDCDVYGNGGSGVVANGNVQGCSIWGNYNMGLVFMGPNSSIRDNEIFSNGGYGVFITQVDFFNGSINFNSIFGNGPYDLTVNYSCLAPASQAHC